MRQKLIYNGIFFSIKIIFIDFEEKQVVGICVVIGYFELELVFFWKFLVEFLKSKIIYNGYERVFKFKEVVCIQYFRVKNFKRKKKDKGY